MCSKTRPKQPSASHLHVINRKLPITTLTHEIAFVNAQALERGGVTCLTGENMQGEKRRRLWGTCRWRGGSRGKISSLDLRRCVHMQRYSPLSAVTSFLKRSGPKPGLGVSISPAFLGHLYLHITRISYFCTSITDFRQIVIAAESKGSTSKVWPKLIRQLNRRL